jgi:hypothetical protein
MDLFQSPGSALIQDEDSVEVIEMVGLSEGSLELS